MDTSTLLGASLAFSGAALPIILILFVKNLNKTIENNNLKFEKKIETLIDDKLTKFRNSLNLEHKKLSVETLDRISSRLIKLGERHNKDFLDNIYEE